MQKLLKTTAVIACIVATAGLASAQGGPCEALDNGTGTVTMPPIGCGYVSPADYHMIVNGLPAGWTCNIRCR